MTLLCVCVSKQAGIDVMRDILLQGTNCLLNEHQGPHFQRPREINTRGEAGYN